MNPTQTLSEDMKDAILDMSMVPRITQTEFVPVLDQADIMMLKIIINDLSHLITINSEGSVVTTLSGEEQLTRTVINETIGKSISCLEAIRKHLTV